MVPEELFMVLFGKVQNLPGNIFCQVLIILETMDAKENCYAF